MKKSISIFGVTGSVGNSTIELLRKIKSEFDLISITCNDDIDNIISLAKEFNPKIVAIANDIKFKEVKKNLPSHIKCLVGTEGICEAASYESDIVIASIVGCIGAPAANVAGAIGATASNIAAIVSSVEERAAAA